MKHLLPLFLPITIGISFFFLAAHGQNLVPNPSFEEYSECPTQTSEIFFATGWINANTGTADYFNTCYVEGGGTNMDVPGNFMGIQAASSGNAYAGIMLFENSSEIEDYREYLQAQLAAPLVAGTTYYVSFKISRADSSCYLAEGVAVYFSNSQISQGDFFNVDVLPHIESSLVAIPDNDTIWHEVHGSFEAGGGESYVVIGNFKDDFNTPVTTVCTTDNLDFKSAYYYIDDVCVSSDSLECIGITNIDFPIPNRSAIKFVQGYLDIVRKDSRDFNVLICDALGNVVYRSADQRKFFRLETNFLNAGVYMVIVYDKFHKQSKKVFINN